MQNKNTKTTKEHRDWMFFCKSQPCMGCGAHPPVDFHHIKGSKFKHNKVEIGHYYGIGLCRTCHNLRHHAGKKTFFNKTGKTEHELFWMQLNTYEPEFPWDVIEAIKDWGR